jgi:tetratricopeptide (TPR) repeat protein
VRLLASTAIIALLAGNTPAIAQPQAPDTRSKAASHFKEGQLYFENGDYDRAITEYREAYELSTEPLLLFNIALCEDRAKRYERALDMFWQYLDLAPAGEVADEARENVTRLVPIVEDIQRKRANAAAAAAEAEAAKHEEAAQQEEARRREAAAQQERQREHRDVELDRRARRARYERWGGLGAGAVGAVSVGVAIAYGLKARSDGDAIREHTTGGWTDDLLSREDAGKSANTKMIVLSIVGGVCLVGGGALYMIGRHGGARVEHERLQLRAAPTSGGAAAWLQLRF